jgi:hypothetical protein
MVVKLPQYPAICVGRPVQYPAICVGRPVQYFTTEGAKAAIITGVYMKIQSLSEPVLSNDGIAKDGCTLVDLQVMDEKGGFDLSHVPLASVPGVVGHWDFLPD